MYYVNSMKTSKRKLKITTSKAKKLGRPFSNHEIKMVHTIRVRDSDLECIKKGFGSLQRFVDCFIESVSEEK